jgi:hypothetical protein
MVSKSIIRLYIGLAAFIGFLALIFTYLAFFTSAGLVMLGASFILLVLVEPLFLMLIRSLRNTKYILSENELTIDTSILIGGSKKIKLHTIESAEKTLYPLGLKLFGASFHGGYYSIPGLGRAFIAVTNLKDAILIRTTHNNYIISPRNPTDFLETLKSKKINLKD